ncbi:MAG: prohibitin family protein [Clostridia bacterium]|nr:prohibitin family protein [Clostridia bacterium]MBQ8973553.1 prohibitin family protein [Clostridia bacterium]
MEMNEMNVKNTRTVRGGNAPRRLLVIALGIVILIALVSGCIRSVPTGYTGILTTFGKVEQSNLDAGVHLKAPWQKIVLMDNRVQKQTLDTQSFSADIQQVDVRETVTYRINSTAAAVLYEKVGTHYFENILYPQLLENTKTVFAQYSAEGLVEHRDALAEQIAERMKEDVGDYGIDIVTVAIENIDFSDRFTDAIEAKQVATQELQRAQTQQQQANLEAKAAAERQRIAAQAEADVAKIAADADAYAITAKAQAEAEANKKIAESLTDALIDYTEAQNWNGQLPGTVVGADGGLPIIGVNP